MRFFVLFLLSVSISACGINANKEAETFDGFSTDESSKLFFKNVRRSYYDVTILEAAKLETYRFKKRVVSEEQPIINLAIVNNWRYDEAYVLLEPNAVLNQDELKIRWEEEGQQKELVFANTNKDSHGDFADKVYELINAEIEMEIWAGDSWRSFLNTSQSKEAFRLTMYDYYRLVRRI